MNPFKTKQHVVVNVALVMLLLPALTAHAFQIAPLLPHHHQQPPVSFVVLASPSLMAPSSFASLSSSGRRSLHIGRSHRTSSSCRYAMPLIPDLSLQMGASARVVAGISGAAGDHLSLWVSSSSLEETTAFTDDFDALADPTIRSMLGGFAVVVILLLVVKFVMTQADAAMETVLSEFETTLQKKYPSRWTTIEDQYQLATLTEPERSQRLLQIMEQLQQDDPQFMKQVNEEMSNVTWSELDSRDYKN
mmetsp:Transcript_20418/g.36986  ORF Transcript_20418/g.36986 Transcript_20418/m.36986 type:complete len:248 (-) Transcript_20418:1274-2017(-)